MWTHAKGNSLQFYWDFSEPYRWCSWDTAWQIFVEDNMSGISTSDLPLNLDGLTFEKQPPAPAL